MTVPSCDLHNMKKSADDEYLLYVLATCHAANDTGQGQFTSKIMRAINCNPELMKRILEKSAPAVAGDAKGMFETVVALAEGDRLKSPLEKMGRALYFKHFKRKWTAGVKVIVEFMFFTSGRSPARANQNVVCLSAMADRLFEREKPYGENPEVFSYTVACDEIRGTFIRLRFYGEAKVLLFFPSDQTPIPVVTSGG